MNTQKQIFLIVALMFVFVGGCAAYTIIDLPVRAADQTAWHKDQSIERGFVGGLCLGEHRGKRRTPAAQPGLQHLMQILVTLRR